VIYYILVGGIRYRGTSSRLLVFRVCVVSCLDRHASVGSGRHLDVWLTFCASVSAKVSCNRRVLSARPTRSAATRLGAQPTKKRSLRQHARRKKEDALMLANELVGRQVCRECFQVLYRQYRKEPPSRKAVICRLKVECKKRHRIHFGASCSNARPMQGTPASFLLATARNPSSRLSYQ